jgi:Fic family protein
MDLWDEFEDNRIFEDNREYSVDEIPVNIGKWLSYMPYHDIEQLKLQRENILRVPLLNNYGRIGFILSKNIDMLEQYLQDVSSKVRIENTQTVLETEVYYTSKIEGAKTTLIRTQAIHNGSPIREDNKYSEAMIKGNFEAVKLLNLYGNKLNEAILYKIWDTLTKDCRDNRHIQGKFYRNGEITVTDSNFQSVSVSELYESMNLFLDFYNGPILHDRPFIKSCIIHFAFETIHPFCDGNGRLGRLLMNNYLIKQGIESCRAVSFSQQIDKNRGLYDAAFIDGENRNNDCTPFVEYMLDIMAKSYLSALKV